MQENVHRFFCFAIYDKSLPEKAFIAPESSAELVRILLLFNNSTRSDDCKIPSLAFRRNIMFADTDI